MGETVSMRLILTPERWRTIGYARDAAVILIIALGGMYILDHPEKFDEFLHWTIGHYYRPGH
jgi:hypothetical protein